MHTPRYRDEETAQLSRHISFDREFMIALQAASGLCRYVSRVFLKQVQHIQSDSHWHTHGDKNTEKIIIRQNNFIFWARTHSLAHNRYVFKRLMSLVNGCKRQQLNLNNNTKSHTQIVTVHRAKFETIQSQLTKERKNENEPTKYTEPHKSTTFLILSMTGYGVWLWSVYWVHTHTH